MDFQLSCSPRPGTATWRIAGRIAGCLLLAFRMWADADEPPRSPASEVASAAGRALAQLIHDQWEFELAENPLLATQTGDTRYNDRLPQATLAAAQRRATQREAFLQKLRAIDDAQLTAAERLNRQLLERQLSDDVAAFGFQAHLLPITNRSGFHIEFPELPREVPLATSADYQNYVQRLQSFDRYVSEHIELLRAGIATGMVLPAVVLEGFREAIEAQIIADPTQSLLFQPVKEFPASVPDAERAALTEAVRLAIQEHVVPGYRAFLDFMTREYVPAARGTIACAALPNGRAYYQHLVRHHTTLDLSPEQVHQTGLEEVRRIDAEMLAVLEQLNFQGTRGEFIEQLRTDSKFYATTPEQLLAEVCLVLKRIDGQLPGLFGRLPRTPYGIREVPAYIAPRTTTAYYLPPAGDGSRAGFYYVNTFNLKTRPLYEIEALSLHEAVPGHHLQIALQQELTNVPAFRRFSGYTAFVEGWGLYAERLGLEMGFYQDPYRNFGRLSYEAWRACRLVVDSGMHALGWSRQQAIDFMAEHTALTRHNIVTEVDRYIAWPGQALAYKTGELKLRELRRRAEETLGPRFDVRAFHDVVLALGAVPLDALERRVLDWLIEQQSARTP